MAFPSIKINIGADVSRLGKDLKKGESIVGSFGKFAGNTMANLAIGAQAAAIAIGVDGVKAAIEDQAAQATLAKTLENVTKATSAQVKSVEDYITKTTLATGVSDSKLRPSLDRLIRSTKDVTKAQQLQTIALDVAAGTGKDLEAVTNAIAKAYDGNFGALKRLGVPLDEATVKSKDFNKVQETLAKTFSGQLDASLDTQAGKIKLLSNRWDEMKENIGYVLLDGLQPLMDWASGPEGQKFLQDFMEAFKDAALSVAKALPDILESLKKIGGAASAMGINFDSLLTPEALAAGVAWKATPGGPQMKALAAVAAYAAKKSESAEAKGEGNILTKAMDWGQKNTAFGILQGIIGNEQGVPNSIASAYNEKLASLGLRPVNTPAYNIIINGVTDPAQAAKNVSRALNKAQRMGVNKAAYGTGT